MERRSKCDNTVASPYLVPILFSPLRPLSPGMNGYICRISVSGCLLCFLGGLSRGLKWCQAALVVPLISLSTSMPNDLPPNSRRQTYLTFSLLTKNNSGAVFWILRPPSAQHTLMIALPLTRCLCSVCHPSLSYSAALLTNQLMPGTLQC